MHIILSRFTIAIGRNCPETAYKRVICKRQLIYYVAISFSKSIGRSVETKKFVEIRLKWRRNILEWSFEMRRYLSFNEYKLV